MTQGKTFLFVQGVTHFAFMKSKLKFLMNLNNPKCHVEFKFGQFQVIRLYSCYGWLISWGIAYNSRYKILHFLKKIHVLQPLLLWNRNFWGTGSFRGEEICIFPQWIQTSHPTSQGKQFPFFALGFEAIIYCIKLFNFIDLNFILCVAFIDCYIP